MSYPREVLLALAEAVRVLHAARHPLTAVREAVPLLGAMLGTARAAVEELACGDERPAAPSIWL